ncbi:MAG: hypothetical protein M1820_001319 [Bogoriella megaspora]|nr:MAG: hypothetical protein M1820_001319 [Bogoriella megaspora]
MNATIQDEGSRFEDFGKNTLQSSSGNSNGRVQEIRTSPLFSSATKSLIKYPSNGPPMYNVPQYALLGWERAPVTKLDDNHALREDSEAAAATKTELDTSSASSAKGQLTIQEGASGPVTQSATTGATTKTDELDYKPMPILLNTDTPWSAFICGSQGSGKSHTVSCMLENCLLRSLQPNYGQLPGPLAGVVFHYGSEMESVCEAAYLCTNGIPVRVLVSPSRAISMKQTYENAFPNNRNLQVRPLKFQPKHLNASRMKTLMAFEEGATVPLYMATIEKILMDMGEASQTEKGFSYIKFRQQLQSQGDLQGGQTGPLQQRFHRLEMFLQKANFGEPLDGSTKAWLTKKDMDELANDDGLDIFENQPGTLTVVDLSDPFLNTSMVRQIFDITLRIFLDQERGLGGRIINRIVALDEAHRYLEDASVKDSFTEGILDAIRLQRHLGTSIIVSTQEPTVSTKLLDLCSMTFVHRFTSPAWFAVLRSHIAGLSDSSLLMEGSESDDSSKSARAFFKEIVELGIGEALLFSPSAVVKVNDDRVPKKLGMDCLRFQTRPRLTEDGGLSQNAVGDGGDSDKKRKGKAEGPFTGIPSVDDEEDGNAGPSGNAGSNDRE